MTPLWTAAQAADATGGQVSSDWQANGVSIDTRTLKPGDLFVALKDVRDGHDFVAQALEKGAAAAMVSRVPEHVKTAKLLVVEDVLPALERMAQAARARTAARVIGVTGSVGKTSTKEMLRTVLSGQGKTHAAEASYNNHWGVPLTLARMPAATDFAVIEIGMNHPGEIAPLARLASLDLAMITTVAPAHLEAFENIEGIAREKASIFSGLTEGGRALFPLDLPVSTILRGPALAADPIAASFGAEPGAEYRLADVALQDDQTSARAVFAGNEHAFKLSVAGRHFASNAVAVLGIVDLLGLDVAKAAADLFKWHPPMGRGTRERLQLASAPDNFVDLIDDAYNANPTSMAAALDVLAATEPAPGGRRLAFLGDMLEMGPTEMAQHAALADLSSIAKVDGVHTSGPRMAALHHALPAAKRGNHAETSDTLAAAMAQLVRPGDVLLVKGSLGSKMRVVVDAIRKLGHPLPAINEEQA